MLEIQPAHDKEMLPPLRLVSNSGHAQLDSAAFRAALDILPNAVLLLHASMNELGEEEPDLKVAGFNQAAAELLALPIGDSNDTGFQNFFASESEWERFGLIFRLWKHLAEDYAWKNFQTQYKTLALNRRQQDADPSGLSFRWYSLERTPIWVALSLSQICDGLDGRCTLLCSVHDITTQKLQEQRLRERQESFVQAQGLAQVGSWEMAPDGQDMWCSDEFYRIFGLEPQSFAPSMQGFIARVHPDDQTKVQQAITQALARDGHYRVEHRIVRPDGEIRLVCGQGILERDGQGQPIGLHGTLQDTTERRRAQDELAIANKVFENAIEGVMVTDALGVIQSVNRAFTDITGYTADEAIGRKPNFLRSERHDTEFYSEMWQTLLANKQWSGEIWNRRKNGEAYLEQLIINGVLDASGQTSRYIGVFHDLTHIKRNEENLAFRENHDALTGLVNRSLLSDLLGQSLSYAQRDGSKVAVMMLGLDRFKQINETLGHPAGDSLLFNMAWRLSATVRENDIVARFGGDTFVIVCPSLDSGTQEAMVLAQKLMKSLAEPFEIESHQIFMTASIGVVVYPEDGSGTEEILRNAELAMNRAKQQGRDTYQFYTSSMNESVSKRLMLETEMRRAIENEEFEVFYQPKYSPGQGRIVGMEALVRWRHPEKGMISPADFIPLAEETGMIVGIGEQVLRHACRQTRLWHDMGHDLTVAVNLSARQFRLKNLIILIEDILAGAGLPADRLELEITESSVMNDVEEAIGVLNRMREAGFKISMDDFGTGYSSLSYLKRFPINKLKIDQSFVRDMHTNIEDASIVDAVISLARSLKINVVAEGVELQEHLDILTRQGCDEIQGYLISRPLPAEQFEKFLGEGYRSAP